MKLYVTIEAVRLAGCAAQAVGKAALYIAGAAWVAARVFN